jgi:flagellar hook-associated protein FlgK
MSSLSAIALTGLSAAQTALQASSHNIANLGTANFRRQGVAQSTQSGGGTTARVFTAPELGHNEVADTVGLLEARHAFAANLAVFKTGDQMMGTLLHMVA